MAYYQQRTINNQLKTLTDSITDAQFWDVNVPGGLPAGASSIPQAQWIGKPVTFDAKRILNYVSFKRNPNYFNMWDARPSTDSLAACRARGIDKFSSVGLLPGEDLYSLPDSEKWDQVTENGILGDGTPGGPDFFRGHYFFWGVDPNKVALAEIEQFFNNRIAKHGPGAHWSANIEESLGTQRQYYDSGYYPAWESVKNRVITLELTSQQMTLEQLVNDPTGLYQYEVNVRLGNRMGLMCQIAKKNGAYVGYGGPLWAYYPHYGALGQDYFFLSDVGMRYDQVPGFNSSNQTITLNGRVYDGSGGHFQKHQTFNDDYRYFIDPVYTGTNKEAEPDYPALWAKLDTHHLVAWEIGGNILTHDRMQKLYGKRIANVRQLQIYIENNLTQPYAWSNSYEKVDAPPGWVRDVFMISEFMNGDVAGSGKFVFDNFITTPGLGRGIAPMNDLATLPRWNKHWDAYKAISQATKDFENYQSFIKNSAMVTDIEFKLQGSANWDIYNAVTAYGVGKGGDTYTRKPAAVMRYALDTNGMYVVFCIGHKQSNSTTRTDLLRIPSIMSTNAISVTYKGEGAKWFEVFIPNGTNNTTYVAKAIISQTTQPGYEGFRKQ